MTTEKQITNWLDKLLKAIFIFGLLNIISVLAFDLFFWGEYLKSFPRWIVLSYGVFGISIIHVILRFIKKGKW